MFVAAALALSRTAAPAFDALFDQLRAPGEVAVAAFLVLSLACFAAQAFGLEAALGAFAGGLILSSSKRREAIEKAIQPLVALFATVFFVLIGSSLNLAVLNPFNPANHAGLLMAGFLLAAALLSKLAAGWSYLSQEPTNRLAVGLAMMPAGGGGPDLSGPRQPERRAGPLPGGRHPADGDRHHLPGPGAVEAGAEGAG